MCFCTTRHANSHRGLVLCASALRFRWARRCRVFPIREPPIAAGGRCSCHRTTFSNTMRTLFSALAHSPPNLPRNSLTRPARCFSILPTRCRGGAPPGSRRRRLQPALSRSENATLRLSMAHRTHMGETPQSRNVRRDGGWGWGKGGGTYDDRRW